MKKYTPYIIAVAAFIVLLVLLISTGKKANRIMDERVTLRYKDKIPYGFYAAYHLLPYLFPGAAITTNKQSPVLWNSTNKGQAAIVIAKRFDPEEDELQKMLRFAEGGNTVFIICRSLSYSARTFFDVGEDYDADDGLPQYKDSLEVALSSPRFTKRAIYRYPGKHYATAVTDIDSARMLVLGRNKSGKPNFIQLKKGAGNIYVHLAPLTFSNYFILHKNNIAYFQQAISVIPAGVKKIIWNDYYLTRRRPQDEDKEPNWLGVLFRYESFKWALLTAIITLLLFALLEMRRRQRIIPVLKKPVNDSLDFVKTIGRLYHERGDHKDLATKMAAHFSEHVRTRYKLTTETLDDDFVQALHGKSGYPVAAIKKLTSFMYYLQTNSRINEHQLTTFYNNLESFYQNT